MALSGNADPTTDAWDAQQGEWAELDEIAGARFGGARLVSRLLVGIAWIVGCLGVLGAILFGVFGAATSSTGLSVTVAIVIAVAGAVEVIVVSALMAAAGYGLKILLALWAETWDARQKLG